MNNIHHSLESLAIDIDKLSFLEGNPRKGDIEAVAKSYKQFGQRKPIVATKDYVVIAGNHQLAAARQLGWDRIAVVITDDDELTAKAFALADNRTAELGSYDDDLLADLLSEVSSVPELMDSTGFSEDDLFDLIGFDDEPEEEQEIEVPVEPKTKLGDMYKLGNHYLYCEDSLNLKNVKKLINESVIDLVFTDPPYGVEYTGGLQFENNQGIRNQREMIENDNNDIFEQLFYVLSKVANSACYIWHGAFSETTENLFKFAKKYGDIHSVIVWVKNGGYGALTSHYKPKHEPLLYWKPKGKKLNFKGASTETTIWEYNKDGINNYHPTQKPLDLAKKAILNHECKTVLDLFGGSGSTLIAAEQIKKQCFMMELDPAYCDVIIERWENLTGQKAELING